jgi:hypothetical protein
MIHSLKTLPSSFLIKLTEKEIKPIPSRHVPRSRRLTTNVAIMEARRAKHWEHWRKGGYKGDAAYLYMEYFDVAYRRCIRTNSHRHSPMKSRSRAAGVLFGAALFFAAALRRGANGS